MATTVTRAGVSYSVPAYDDTAWAQGVGNLSTYLISLATAPKQYTQTFTTQTSVTVTHNLGLYPLVQVLDNSGNVIIPDTINHGSTNAFTVSFTPALTGTIVYMG